MLNKNDPLIGAVQEVMKRNHAEREAAKLVNEKFGVTDRKALPHEKQGAWDAAYKQILSEGLHPNQQKLDVHEPEKDKLTKHDFKMLRAKKKSVEEDVTSPSSMGIKKPNYASGTPDYAKPTTQTVNRAAKTSLPAGTMKEEEQIDEKAPPGAKYERMVKHIKDKMSKGGLTKKEKSIAYATAWKAKKKSDVNEGFNNRHDLSVTASVEEQVVADQLNEQETYADYDPAKETRNKFAKLSGATSGRRVRNFLSQRKFLKANPPQGSLKAEPGNYRVNKAIDQAKAFASGAVGYGSDYEKFYPRAAETGKLAGIGSMLLPGRPVVATGQTAAKLPAVATQTTNVTNKFRANLANRRYNVSGAQQRPPQSVAPAAQGSVPAVAQGAGQGNRLAAIRRPDRGPWGSTRQADRPPSAGSSQPRNTVPSGTMAARLRQQGQQAQQNRAGGSTVAANQTAARTRLSQQTQQSRVGTNTTAATQTAARTSLAQRVKDIRAGAPMAGVRRIAQTGPTDDGTSRSLVPKTAQAGTSADQQRGAEQDKVGVKRSPTATSTGVTARKIEATPRKVSDTEIMNAPQYKQAVKAVGGEAGARRIQAGTDVAGVGKVEKGQTIWSKVKSQLEKQPVKGFEMGANKGGAGR